MDIFLLNYSVGPLLYCPAANKTVSDSIIEEKFGQNYSLSLCLEDTIDDSRVEEAEQILLHTFRTLARVRSEREFYLPKIFIRVRNPEQIPFLYEHLGESRALLTGFTVPKFSLENADAYIGRLLQVNASAPSPIYMMPILENPVMIHLKHRYEILYGIREKLEPVKSLVLNIRVGGNDLCHTFGFRRQVTETIYDIYPVAGILSDIMTVFGTEYILSGPVFEYYNGSQWEQGLENELQKDRLNGFVGKTVIHPNQIAVVNRAYMVSRSDYEDAMSILDWKPGSILRVAGSAASSRMNEYKTHHNWAKRIIALSQVYGISDAICRPSS